MLKLFYVIFMNLHRAPYMIPRMRAEADHPQRYTEEQRYSLVQHAIYLMNKTGKINTVETGAENCQSREIHDVSEPSGQI